MKVAVVISKWIFRCSQRWYYDLLRKTKGTREVIYIVFILYKKLWQLWERKFALICALHTSQLHIQDVYVFDFVPLLTGRCSFKRSSSFVCHLSHGHSTMEALCPTSIRSATPALNFRWDFVTYTILPWATNSKWINTSSRQSANLVHSFYYV